MKTSSRIGALGLSLVLAVFVPQADALPLGPTLQAGASASFPVKPGALRDQWNTGFGFSGALMFKTLPLLSIGFETGYYEHGSDSGAFEDNVLEMFPGVQFDGFNYWFVPVTAVAELNLLRWGVTKPFLRAGAGFYRVGTTDFSASGFASDQIDEGVLGEFSDSAFGTLIGFGVRTPLVPGFSLSFDVTYHAISTDGEATHFLPIRVRIEF